MEMKKLKLESIMNCMGVTNHWTELDWTGLDWTHSKFLFRPFQRRTKAKHAYLLMHLL